MAQSMLIYGESSVFKTTQIGLFADYEFERTGLPTRLITCDSGFGPVQDQVMRGTIIPLRLESAPHPVPVLNKLSKGLWPLKIINEHEGLWGMSPGDAFVPMMHATGAIAVEGLTRICELVRKAWCDEHREMGEPLQGKYEQDGESFAFQSRGTLFGVQQLINNLVIGFRGLPVDRVLFTAHESKGRDVSGKTVFGPATTGQALTDKVCGWFEVTLHHESYSYSIKVKSGKTVVRPGVRAYFTRHQDHEVKGMYWPAKLGVSAAISSRIFDIYEDGWIPLAMQGEEYVSGLHSLLYLIDSNGTYDSNEQSTDVAQVTAANAEYIPPQLDSASESNNDATGEVAQDVSPMVSVDTAQTPEVADVAKLGKEGGGVKQANKRRGKR